MGVFDNAKKAYKRQIEPELKKIENQVNEVWKTKVEPELERLEDQIKENWNNQIEPELERLEDQIKENWNNQIEPELKKIENQVNEVWKTKVEPELERLGDKIEVALDDLGNVIGFIAKDPSKDLCADNIINCDKIHWDAIFSPLEAAARTLGTIISDDEINCIKRKVSIQLGEPSLENKFHNYKLALTHMISIGQNECSLATKAILKAIGAKGLVDSIVRSVENHHEKWAAYFKIIKFNHTGIELGEYKLKELGTDAFFNLEKREINLESFAEYLKDNPIEYPEIDFESFENKLKVTIDNTLALAKENFNAKLQNLMEPKHTLTDTSYVTTLLVKDIISRIEPVDVAVYENYLIPTGQTVYQENELEGN